MLRKKLSRPNIHIWFAIYMIKSRKYINFKVVTDFVIVIYFRCVDEINQGMDATNERNIFELLLKEATKEGSAQYLFVTPKVNNFLIKF